MPRPAPWPTRNSAFFWEGCKRGVLMAQRCSECRATYHPPRPMCPRCRSFTLEPAQLSGRATLHSWAKPVHPPMPMFEPGYLVALVDLEEGPRMLSNLCEIDPAEVEVGMALEVFFVETADEGAVHQFRPLRADGAGKSAR